MKFRTSTIVMIAVWVVTFVVYVLVRPDSSTSLPLKMIPLLTQSEQSAPTTTAPRSTTAPKQTTTTPESTSSESTTTPGSPAQ